MVDVLRGKHSTGVAMVSAGGGVDVFKKAVNAVDFLDFKTYANHMKFKYNCLLGHNRYATKGEVNNINAHPFEFDNVVGMHNGTLRNYNKLDDSTHFDVDSECLYSHINDNGIQDAVNNIRGAYALTWFDKDTNKLHFLRNSERPLHYCFTKDNKTMFWASESWMLHAVLSRNGIAYQDVLTVTEDVLYSFDVHKEHSTYNTTVSSPKVCKMVKPPVEKKSNVTSLTSTKKLPDGTRTFASYINEEVEFCVNDSVIDNFKSHYVEGFIYNDTGKDIRIYTPQFGELTKELIEKRDLGNFKGVVRRFTRFQDVVYLILDLRTIEFVGAASWEVVEEEDTTTVEGFQGAKLTMAQFNQATRKHCAWCSSPAFFGDPLLWVDVDEFVCENCHAQPEILEWIGESFPGGL